MSAVEHVHIPEKLFYRINEVSSITQIKPYVLRYWESEFPMLSPEKDENDQRRYRRGDIELILEIKRLLYVEKFTIAGARKQLRQNQESAPPARPQAAAPTMVTSGDAASPAPSTSNRSADVARQFEALRQEIEDLYRLLA